ncbi:MAG: adenylyl-sulfate kinase [Thermoleophilia bacterium]
MIIENEMATAVKEKGFVVWLTGIPGSGKTTISDILVERLRDLGRTVECLDGDDVRRNLSPELGFSKEDRETHARRVAYVSKLLARNHVAVVVALISPYRSFREHVRSQIDDFVEVYVDASVEECIRRDPKGLYKKALAGEISDLTGLQDTYEAPETPEVWVQTEEQTPQESADTVMDKLVRLGYLSL